MVFNDLYTYLTRCIDKHYDWEQVWILYTLIKIDRNRLYEKLSELLEYKLSELAVIMITNEYETLDKSLVVNLAKESSWLLKYELYRNNYLDESCLSNYKLDGKVISNFQKLKECNCKLYFYPDKK